MISTHLQTAFFPWTLYRDGFSSWACPWSSGNSYAYLMPLQSTTVSAITSASSIELGEIEMLAITSDGGLETNFSIAFTQRKEEVRGRQHLMKGEKCACAEENG